MGAVAGTVNVEDAVGVAVGDTLLHSPVDGGLVPHAGNDIREAVGGNGFFVGCCAIPIGNEIAPRKEKNYILENQITR